MIKINDLSVQFAENKVLKKLNHSFAENKVTALIGPSGCGKTTLLNTIAGLTPSFQGSIEISGKLYSSENSSDWPTHRFGYVVQNGGLFPHLTNQQNIVLRDLGIKPFSESRLAELVEITKVSNDWLKRFPKEISGGQQQRVALARALYHNPDCLLLDEPFAALDPILRRELQLSLRELFQKLSKTVIFVTHDLKEAEMIGDVIAVMNNGLIEQVDSGARLRTNPKTEFVKRFVEVF